MSQVEDSCEREVSSHFFFQLSIHNNDSNIDIDIHLFAAQLQAWAGLLH